MPKNNFYIPLRLLPYIFVSVTAITIAATTSIII